MKKIYLGIILFLITSFLLAEEDIENDRQLAGSPLFSYAKETGFTYGGMLLYRFRPENMNIKVPKNSLKLQAVYTQKKQFQTLFEPEFRFQNGLYRLYSNIKYQDWPSSFYGIGNDSDEGKYEKYTAESLSIEVDISKRIRNNWFLGFIYEFKYFNMKKSEINGVLQSEEIPGSDNYTISGIGFSFTRDSRNNVFFPLAGKYFKFHIKCFDSSFGSDYNFIEYELDSRTYINISGVHVLAFQNILCFIDKNPPFDSMAHLGDEIRAFEPDLFIDKHMFITRVEYRFFPWKSNFLNRLGFAEFLEIGQVAHELKDFGISELKFCYGCGLRFSLFQHDRLNLRVDIGFWKDLNSLTFNIGEAF